MKRMCPGALLMGNEAFREFIEKNDLTRAGDRFSFGDMTPPEAMSPPAPVNPFTGTDGPPETPLEHQRPDPNVPTVNPTPVDPPTPTPPPAPPETSNPANDAEAAAAIEAKALADAEMGGPPSAQDREKWEAEELAEDERAMAKHFPTGLSLGHVYVHFGFSRIALGIYRGAYKGQLVFTKLTPAEWSMEELHGGIRPRLLDSRNDSVLCLGPAAPHRNYLNELLAIIGKGS